MWLPSRTPVPLVPLSLPSSVYMQCLLLCSQDGCCSSEHHEIPSDFCLCLIDWNCVVCSSLSKSLMKEHGIVVIGSHQL